MSFLEEYFALLVFILVSGTVSAGFVIGAFLVSAPAPISHIRQGLAYECGFDPVSAPRAPFHVQFYLVGILFIIFDVEMAFLLPWALVLEQLTAVGFWTMMAFLGILTVGLVYEWYKGALEWV